MTETITPAEVRLHLLTRQEIALLDVREEASFALSHPLFASQISAGLVEIEALDRLPRQQVLVVVYDDGEGLVDTAVRRLAALGYRNTRILQGGLKGWAADGGELFQDVNSYSKAFGEVVEGRRHTPLLPAPELDAMLRANADVAVMDARRYDEYKVMSIPKGTSVPGAELVLRAQALAPDPDTTIVVNCAGRTRSIIGAQSLINAGLPNRIYALCNGTIGWTLAGLELEHGQSRCAPDVAEDARNAALERARDVSYRAGVKVLTGEQVALLAADATRTLYRFDVRTPEEYAAGHVPGFRSAPGGQLVQETDMVAPVRGARIVLWDNLGVRAHMSGSWLAQMGWEVYVVEGRADEAAATGPWTPTLPSLPAVDLISVKELAQTLGSSQTIVVDLAPSTTHRSEHVPGARFAIRARLDAAIAALPETADIVLTSPDAALATFAAADLETNRKVRVLKGGTAAWAAAGYPLEAGFFDALSPPDDIYKRPYVGTDNAAAQMQAYLDWEYGLVDQLRRDGTHGFFVI
ncbi:rhodanese-like domain-containing protein [Rhizorhabdus argentea]|uniref:rhodanese-like domain-containing protein n=1 Tax=Rhizorhabdus argentea TaxID=1387174 RepID=UPI003BF5739D